MCVLTSVASWSSLAQLGMARISILMLALGHYLHIDVLSHCTARHGQIVCTGVGLDHELNKSVASHITILFQ